MARLSDTQLIILSAASQRADRGVELPADIKGEARKAVNKLIRAGLREGSAPLARSRSGAAMTIVGRWPFASPSRASKQSMSRMSRWLCAQGDRTPAAEIIVSRKRSSVAAEKSARKKHQPPTDQISVAA